MNLLDLVKPDGLTTALVAVGERHLAPVVNEIRTELLNRVTGDPPEGFVRAFCSYVDDAGWQLDPEIAELAWRAVIAAIAAEPARC
jgi:hypothetical protein